MSDDADYIIEAADKFEDVVVLPRKRRPFAHGSCAPPVRAATEAELDADTIVTWPPPARPPAVMAKRRAAHETSVSDGVPHEVHDAAWLRRNLQPRRRPGVRCSDLRR